MRKFTLNRLVSVLSVVGIVGSLSQIAHSAGFQLWEQDAASVGNYHAGYAVEAADASTVFYNPAGITKFKNQQIVAGADSVITDIKYVGTIAVNTILGNTPRSVTAQGGNFNLIPFLHYVTPLTDNLGFGFTVNVPFGLKTTYGRNTILQFAATTTATSVVDISPALAYKITDKGSIGAGFDIQRMSAEFDSEGGVGFPTTMAESVNKVNDTGYGGHVGALYDFSPNSRIGLSYHSQVVHHLNGSSQLTGPLATSEAGGPVSSQVFANMTLPPYTALSLYQRIHPKVVLLGTAIRTQWNLFRTLTLNGVTGINDDGDLDKTMKVTVLQYYRNTWNLSVGANFAATEDMTLKAGIGYDQTPTSAAYRMVQMPDNNRIAVALGGHYQASTAIGVDLGWQHIFMPQTRINPVSQSTGLQTVTTNGNVDGGADVFGGQIVWNIA